MKKRPHEPKPLHPLLTSVAGPALIKYLASCNTTIRSQSLRLLQSWLQSQPQHLSDADTKKLWKGLFYCLWHSDKTPNQVALIDKLTSLFLSLDPSVSLDFFRGFLITLRREWPGIDRLRLDKFYLLIRRFVKALFELMRLRKWDVEVLGEYFGVLEKDGFLAEDKLSGNGVNYHIVSVFLEELKGVGFPVKKEVIDVVFGPFFASLLRSKDKIMLGKVKSCLFDELVNAGKRLLVKKKMEVDCNVKDGDVLLGVVALKMGLSGMIYEVGSSEECVQGNRKLVLGLHEEFLKLDKELELSKVEIALPEYNDVGDEEAPLLIPIDSNTSNGDTELSFLERPGDGGQSDDRSRKKKSKKAKKGMDEDDKKSKRKEKKRIEEVPLYIPIDISTRNGDIEPSLLEGPGDVGQSDDRSRKEKSKKVKKVMYEDDNKSKRKMKKIKEEVSLLIPIDISTSRDDIKLHLMEGPGDGGQFDDRSRKKKSKKAKKGMDENDKKSKRKKKKRQVDHGVLEIESAVNKNVSTPADNGVEHSLFPSSVSHDLESLGDAVSLNENVISNLQKQFEKVAAEGGSPGDNGSDDDSVFSVTPLMVKHNTHAHKRKRAKGAQSQVSGNLDSNSALDDGVDTSAKGVDKSAKKVRFSMKNNIVWKPQTPLPPESLRLPPSAVPRGSALKKGVPPGPIIETPLVKKKSNQKKKALKRMKSATPIVKKRKKMLTGSA